MQIDYDPMTITTGMMLIFLISYILISIYTYIYLKFTKVEKLKKKKFLFAIAVVSLAWLVSTIIATMFASSYGVLVFAAVSMVLIFGFNFFISEKFLGISGKHKVLYCFALSVIINPTWFSVLGIV